MIKNYTSRPSAVRGLARYLGNANTENLDLASLVKQNGAEFSFDTDAADALVGLKGKSEEDENLLLYCGHTTCPSCGIHLSNGITDFDAMVDHHGSEKEAYKHLKHEFMCLACNHEFGKDIEAPKASAARANKTGRHYPNRAKSDIENPSEIVYALADEMKGAKRKEVVEAAIAKGVTPNTARAAYQHWRKDRGLSKTA